MQTKPYRVVRSTAGHDKGGLFAVIGQQGPACLLIADGKLRKLEKPKKKKLKHVEDIGKIVLMEEAALTNRQLSRALRQFGKEVLTDTEGGI